MSLGEIIPWRIGRAHARGEPLTDLEHETLRESVLQWRERLTNISWYMKCLNEYIARRANAEDNCRGRFWESQFRCQALLDDAAVIAAMCYVDLNPIRAGMADTLEESHFTSIQERIEAVHKTASSRLGSDSGNDDHAAKALAPLMAFQNETSSAAYRIANPPSRSTSPTLPTTFRNYLALVDWTGRQLRHGKRGRIRDNVPPILSRLGLNDREWIDTTRQFNKRFRYAAGAVDILQQWCDAVGRRWLQGRKTALKLYVVTT